MKFYVLHDTYVQFSTLSIKLINWQNETQPVQRDANINYLLLCNLGVYKHSVDFIPCWLSILILIKSEPKTLLFGKNYYIHVVSFSPGKRLIQIKQVFRGKVPIGENSSTTLAL